MPKFASWILGISIFCAGAAVAAVIAGGSYWITALLAAACIVVLFTIAKRKTAAHEQSLSLPPALIQMKHQLGSLALQPSLNPLASRMQSQLHRLEAGMNQARDLLSEKLDPGELASVRFSTGFQSATSAVFSQLQEATQMLTQCSFEESTNSPGGGSSKPHLEKTQMLLDENETALQAFARALAAMTAMNTNSDHIELPQALEQLEQIAQRAGRLSLKQGDENAGKK